MAQYHAAMERWLKYTKPELVGQYTEEDLNVYKQKACLWYDAYARAVFENVLRTQPAVSMQNLSQVMHEAFKPIVEAFYADVHLATSKHASFDTLRDKLKRGNQTQVATNSVRRVASLFLEGLYLANEVWSDWKNKSDTLFLSDQIEKYKIPKTWSEHPLAKVMEYFPPTEEISARLRGIRLDKQYLREQISEDLDFIRKHAATAESLNYNTSVSELLGCAQLRGDFNRLNVQTGAGSVVNKKRTTSAKDIYTQFVETFLTKTDGMPAKPELKNIFQSGVISAEEWNELNEQLGLLEEGLKNHPYTKWWLQEFKQDFLKHGVKSSTELTARKKLTLLCLFEPNIRSALSILEIGAKVKEKYLQVLDRHTPAAPVIHSLQELSLKLKEKNTSLPLSERIATCLKFVKEVAFYRPFETLVNDVKNELTYIAAHIISFYNTTDDKSLQSQYQELASDVIQLNHEFKIFCREMTKGNYPREGDFEGLRPEAQDSIAQLRVEFPQVENLLSSDGRFSYSSSACPSSVLAKHGVITQEAPVPQAQDAEVSRRGSKVSRLFSRGSSVDRTSKSEKPSVPIPEARNGNTNPKQ